MTSWRIECIECGKKESFSDAKDVTFARWKIMAWDINKSEPICICNTCEYGDYNKKLNKKKK